MDCQAERRTERSHRRGSALILTAIAVTLTMAIAAPAQATPTTVAKAWGANGSGELGNGTTTSSDVPVAVSALKKVAALSGSSNHSLALLSNGTVMAWGRNNAGQLGNGTTENSNAPVAVSGLSGATAIAAANGGSHSLALLSNGTVVAWGENGSGQLGNGTTTSSDVPVAVTGLKEVVAISAGELHSLALLKDGTVMAWGFNEEGQLGNGTTIEFSDVPVQVSKLSGVTAISAGGRHSLALLSNGTVMAWGYNNGGQLGDGNETQSDVPVAVSKLSGASAISAGAKHSLALLSNGTVMAWGANFAGQLGDGASAGPETCGKEAGTFSCSKTPAAVSGLSGVTAISGGGNHSLALLTKRTAMAWGANGSGQLGDGTAAGPEACGAFGSCSTKPVAVCAAGSAIPCPSGPFLSNVRGIAAGEEHSLAVVGPPPAGPAEYGQCLPKKHGEYKNSSCTTKSAKANKGKFEWYPGPAPTCVKVKKNKGKYSDAKCETRAEHNGKPRGEYEKEGGPGYTSTTGEATLATSLGVTVKCTAGTDVGEVTGPKTDVDRITFTGCEASGGKCTSLEGAKAEGEIVTSALETELIEPVPGEVWTEYANTAGAHAPYLAIFGCAGVGYFRTKGWLSGVTTGNVNTMSATSQTVFSASAGEQALETEFSTTSTFAETSGPFASTETTTIHNTSASQTEIKT